MCRRRPLVPSGLALAVLMLLPAHPVLAQGTSGMLPGPISSRDIDRYAAQLELGSEQRQALDPFHEQYREAFRELRKGDIEQYVQEVGSMWGRGFRGGFDPEAIQASLNRQERILSKIRLLDESLFSDLQSVLSEEQVVLIPRIMKARERQRYQTGGARMVGSANRAARVDLSRLHERLELTPEEREATEPLVIQYETRLSALVKDLHEASNQVFLDLAEAMAELTVNFEDPNADRGQFFQTMRTAMAEAMRKPQDQAAEIGDLNHASVRRINEFLSAEHAAAFRNRYLRRAYPEMPGASRSPAERAFRAVLKKTDLPDGLRSDVSAAAAEFRATRMRIANETVQYIDDYRRTTMPFGRQRSARQEHDDKLDGFRTRFTALDDATLGALYAMVGADLADTVRMAAASVSGEPEEPEGSGFRGGGGGRRPAESQDAMSAFAAGRGPDPFLPAPITRRDLSVYRDRLGIGNSDWFILESLHEDYLSTFNQIRATDIAALRAGQAEIDGASDDDENVEPPGPERIDEVYELRRRALAAILETDALFFDDIETMLATPAQEVAARRLRLARLREVYNRGLNEGGIQNIFGRRGGRFGRSLSENRAQEAGVDLGRIVDELQLDETQQAEADRLLVEYETSAAEGFRRQYETALALRREVDKLNAANAREVLAARDDGEAERRRWRGRFQGYRDLMEDEGRTAADARKTMVDLNRATLEALAEALGDDVAQELRDAYGRLAFPGIYDDPRGAGRYLRAALALPDLGEQQRSRLEAIGEEYRPAHREVADRLAQIFADQENASDGFDRSQWRRRGEQRNRIEVLEFDRTEINAKALRQLRETLTERQRMQVRLPAEEA